MNNSKLLRKKYILFAVILLLQEVFCLLLLYGAGQFIDLSTIMVFFNIVTLGILGLALPFINRKTFDCRTNVFLDMGIFLLIYTLTQYAVFFANVIRMAYAPFWSEELVWFNALYFIPGFITSFISYGLSLLIQVIINIHRKEKAFLV